MSQIVPLTPKRAALPNPADRPAATEVVRKLGELQSCGYRIYPVSTLQVLHCDPLIPGADRELNQLIEDFDVVTSGTYRSLRPGGRLVSQGPVVRHGKLETPGNRKTWNRGGVAVLEDGTVVVDRMDGGTLGEIQHRFGQPNNPVIQFLGGGAVMVENGQKIQSTDVHGRQEFQRRQGSGASAPASPRQACQDRRSQGDGERRRRRAHLLHLEQRLRRLHQRGELVARARRGANGRADGRADADADNARSNDACADACADVCADVCADACADA